MKCPFLGGLSGDLGNRQRAALGESAEISCALHAHPCHARRTTGRKAASTVEREIERGDLSEDRRQGGVQATEESLVGLSQEDQSEVDSLHARPARRRQLALQGGDGPRERVAHLGREIDGEKEPHGLALAPAVVFSISTPCSRRRKSSRASWVACQRTRSRSPGKRTARWIGSSPPRATATWTVPTGFSSLPPPGPAIPVIPTPISA